MSASSMFTNETMRFLRQLARNNHRDWFQSNRESYERYARTPALEFIESMQRRLRKISPHFLASAQKTGGSLMRVHRDIRFSKDKRPYKANIGIQFRHEMGRDVHAPGFYVHIEPGASFLGVGLWHPESAVLRSIRQMIDDEPRRWKRVAHSRRLGEQFRPAGERLKRAPRDYTEDHPMIEDLKWKDHIRVCDLDDQDVTGKEFPDLVTARFKIARPWMRLLCDALKLPF